MGKRPKIGDILEIRTPAGLAYFQYTHQHPMFGGLIRVLPGVFDVVPDDLGQLAESAERFVTFFPVRAAASRGIIKVVGEAAIPERSRSFPLFRTGLPDPRTRRISDWWLWDGDREWRVGALKAEQIDLPIREIVNDTLLIQRIAKDWSAADTPEAIKQS